MKKVIFIVLVSSMVFLSLPLASQYRYSFPEYMENLQKNVPLKAIEWFEENAYAPTYGVSENIFAFYRGVSRYMSYVKYKGAAENLDKAAGDFKQALEIPYDTRYLYTDRSLLYIAGIFTISEGNKELAARIFKYYADNCEQYDPNYPTAIYWCLYHKYITQANYALYYDRLVKLDKAGVYEGPVIYDYFTGENKSILEMLKRLDSPVNMTPNRYRNISENADVFETIRNLIPVIPEDKNLSRLGATYQYLIFEEYPPKDHISFGAREAETSNLDRDNRKMEYSEDRYRKIDEIITNNNYTNYRTETNLYTNIYTRPVSTTPASSSGLYSLTISVDKVANNNMRIDVAGRTFNTRTSTNFNIQLAQGEYDVLVSFLGKQYTNRVNVSKDAYNLLSIVIQDENIK